MSRRDVRTDMEGNPPRPWSKYLGRPIKQVAIVLLVIFALVFVAFPLLHISYTALFQLVTPEWIGLLLFAYFGFRIIRVLEQIADSQ